MNKQKIIVLIGPSGVGKTSLAILLVKKYPDIFVLIKKHTTRPARPNEKESEDIYINDVDFDKMVKENKFIGTSQPFGQQFRYGLAWPKNIKKIPIVLLRSFVIEQFHRSYDTTLIYQIEQTKEQTKTNMVNRGQDESDINSRLELFDQEINLGKKYAARIITNEKLEVSLQILEKYLSKDLQIKI